MTNPALPRCWTCHHPCQHTSWREIILSADLVSGWPVVLRTPPCWKGSARKNKQNCQTHRFRCAKDSPSIPDFRAEASCEHAVIMYQPKLCNEDWPIEQSLNIRNSYKGQVPWLVSCVEHSVPADKDRRGWNVLTHVTVRMLHDCWLVNLCCMFVMQQCASIAQAEVMSALKEIVYSSNTICLVEQSWLSIKEYWLSIDQ